MMSQSGKQTITIHILPSVQKSKNKQTVKVDRITRETFFTKNHTQNVVEKLFLDPSLKNQNWAYLWINSLKFYTVCFYCMPS